MEILHLENIEKLFVNLKLVVVNAYSNANALANFVKPMH